MMMRVVSGGAAVPSLWRLEVANVLRNAVRRGRCDQAYVDRSLARLGRFPVDDETSVHAWTATRALSREQGLTSYDAAYLELAIRKSQPLATCDAELIAATCTVLSPSPLLGGESLKVLFPAHPSASAKATLQ
jgi:predicted nucleic acid-binding protein